MPTVPPVPLELKPLPLDPAAVGEAVAVCQRAVGLLRTLVEVRGEAAAAARLEWRGPTRETFDHATVRLDAESVELVVELARAIGALGTAAAEVGVENRRRAERRDAWARNQNVPS